MKRCGLLLLLGVSLAPAESDSLWSKLRTRYLTLTTLSGSFTETVYSATDRAVQRFTGTFLIRLPDRYRLEVTAPQRQVIVCADSVVWFYFPDEHRAVRQTQSQSIPILAFLAPVTDPAATTTIEKKTPAGYRLTVHTPDSAALTNLKLELDSTGTRIDGFAFTDDWGNHYHFVLTRQKWNPPIPRRAFQFRPPAGTEVESQ